MSSRKMIVKYLLSLPALAVAAMVLILFWGVGLAAAEAGCPQVVDKTITWVVPRSPGGGYDVYSRLIAPYYGDRLGARFKVVNISGAAGKVGGKKIIQSTPDGRTIGIIGATGWIISTITGKSDAPNPLKDLTILGRAAVNQQVLLASTKSNIKSMADVYALAKKRPILYACLGVSSVSFLDPVITSQVLDLDAQYVTGYRGSQQLSLALMRGEANLIGTAYDSALKRVRKGELRIILQLSDKPIANDPELKGVPLLGGPGGIAALRAKELGKDPQEAMDAASGVAALFQTGRLIVGPAGMAPELVKCLRARLIETLADEKFKQVAAKAGRPIKEADGESAQKMVETALQKAERFVPVLKTAIAQIRK